MRPAACASRKLQQRPSCVHLPLGGCLCPPGCIWHTPGRGKAASCRCLASGWALIRQRVALLQFRTCRAAAVCTLWSSLSSFPCPPVVPTPLPTQPPPLPPSYPAAPTSSMRWTDLVRLWLRWPPGIRTWTAHVARQRSRSGSPAPTLAAQAAGGGRPAPSRPTVQACMRKLGRGCGPAGHAGCE